LKQVNIIPRKVPGQASFSSHDRSYSANLSEGETDTPVKGRTSELSPMMPDAEELLQIEGGSFDESLSSKEAVQRILETIGEINAAIPYFEQLREIDPKDILKQFFDPESGLFVDIEMVMQAISVCCVKISCESVLESLVSVFENHFDPNRNMKEESTTEEFMITVNGPSLGHADAVIREAMNCAQKSGGSTSWQFFRTTVLEQLREHSGGSKVLDRMLKGHSKFPFMDT
ncbi:Hypothetical predicted protein, partial [Paramuricea clavata]